VDFTTLIDVESLRTLIGTPGTLVFDCRFDLAAPAAGRRAYLLGHIRAPRYLDLNRDLSAPVSATSGRHPLPEPQALAALLAGLGLGPDTQAVVYDESNGSFAARAWWLLRWQGHPRSRCSTAVWPHGCARRAPWNPVSLLTGRRIPAPAARKVPKARTVRARCRWIAAPWSAPMS